MIELQMDGKKVLAERVGDLIWIHAGGETWSIAASPPKKRRGGAEADIDHGEVLAPMPGKITRVLTRVGEQVKKGQSLVVMEAMKMEYNLKAAIDGVVQAVDAKVGEQVILGRLLVHIKDENKK